MTLSSLSIRDAVEELYHTESRRVLATLIRLLGDFDLAEEALHDAFASAVNQWQQEGIPKNPRAWLVSTGRFKAIDNLRKRARLDKSLPDLAVQAEKRQFDDEPEDDDSIADDRLRLIFTCCHPALSPEAQIALTLREVCDLKTEEIAAAFLSSAPTIAQRIVRAKSKIRDAGIPYEIPQPSELSERLDTVLRVVYLVFTEGYSASQGSELTRADLTGEAIRLGRLLVELIPEAETLGLLALMLLHESRRTARTDSAGDLVLLADQDRSQWDSELIREGSELVERALQMADVGSYCLQAAIASVHASAKTSEETQWVHIVELYDLLLQVEATSIVKLNRAVAVAMNGEVELALSTIEEIIASKELEQYHLAHSARGDLCLRLNKLDDARTAYETALSLTKQQAERRFIENRIARIDELRASHRSA